MNEPIKLKSNEFWGKQSGTDHPTKGRIFKSRRASNGRGTRQHPQPHENRGGVGRKARRIRKYRSKRG